MRPAALLRRARNMRPSETTLPLVALAFSAVALGFSAIFVRWAAAPGAVSGLYRVSVAAAILSWPFARSVARQGLRFDIPLGMAALGGFLFACDLTAWNTAVIIGSASDATLLANTAPVWVGLGTVALLKTRLPRVFWLGLVLAMAGVAVVVRNDVTTPTSLGRSHLLSLLAGLCYGGFFLSIQEARKGLSSLVAWWVSAVVSAIVMLGFCILMRQSLFGYPASTYLNLVAVGVITQAGGYLGISYALGHLPASLVAPTLLGQPVITSFLAVLLLGERMVPRQVVGSTLLLTGLWVVHRSRGRH